MVPTEEEHPHHPSQPVDPQHHTTLLNQIIAEAHPRHIVMTIYTGITIGQAPTTGVQHQPANGFHLRSPHLGRHQHTTVAPLHPLLDDGKSHRLGPAGGHHHPPLARIVILWHSQCPLKHLPHHYLSLQTGGRRDMMRGTRIGVRCKYTFIINVYASSRMIHVGRLHYLSTYHGLHCKLSIDLLHHFFSLLLAFKEGKTKETLRTDGISIFDPHTYCPPHLLFHLGYPHPNILSPFDPCRLPDPKEMGTTLPPLHRHLTYRLQKIIIDPHHPLRHPIVILTVALVQIIIDRNTMKTMLGAGVVHRNRFLLDTVVFEEIQDGIVMMDGNGVFDRLRHHHLFRRILA